MFVFSCLRSLVFDSGFRLAAQTPPKQVRRRRALIDADRDVWECAAVLDPLTQFGNPVPAGMLGQDPFVKPDLEPIIAEAARQLSCPVLLRTVVAEKDGVL